jgi:mono/diheme cytochrome c family protein
MKTKLSLVFFFSAILAFNSCSKDEAPIAKVTYNKDAKPIFVANCTPCHVSGGVNPNKWDDYTSAKNSIDVILDRINRDPSAAGIMPKVGTKLPDATINILAQWKTDGLLEN